MNYHNITSPDMLNGSGLRTVLWVSGCTNACVQCHNPQTHPFNSGIKFDENALDEVIEKSKPNYIQGLTLSGGDPLHPLNVPMVSSVIHAFRAQFKNTKDIWVYTGYKFEDLIKRTDETRYILDSIDVLVDGKFEIENKDPLLHFRGSRNQRLIDVPATIADGDNIHVLNL